VISSASAQLRAKPLRCGDDERLQVADRPRAAPDRTLTGALEDPDRLALPTTAGLSRVIALERLLGGADRVELVGLRPRAPRRALGPIDLDDAFTALEQVRGEPRAVAAGRLDRPDPAGGRVLLAEDQHPLVAERVGRRRLRLANDAGRGLDHRGGVRVAVGIDADHVVGFVCEHPRNLLLWGWLSVAGPGERSARRDCDGSRPSGRTGF
jgi:hypothetical protein